MATYYVSTDDGNDSNNGLAQTDEGGGVGPWLTKTKVNDTSFSESDKVYFNRGNSWVDTIRLTIDWGGTSEDRAIVGAYGSGALPIISNTSGTRSLVIDDNTINYITVEYLDLRSGTSQVVRVRYSDNVTIRYCKITQPNGLGHGTRFQTVDNLIVEFCEVEWTGTLEDGSDQLNGIYFNSGSYHTARNNIVKNFPHNNISALGDYSYIYKNELSGANRGACHGIGLHGSYAWVALNYLHHLRTRSQSIEGDHHYIYNNVFLLHGNCCSGTGAGYGDCPEDYTDSGDGCADGPTQAQRGGGWFLEDSAEEIHIWNNYFGEIAEAAIRYYADTSPGDTYTIVNNIFDDCGNANEQSDEPPGSGITWQDYSVVIRNSADTTEQTYDIRNNIFYPYTKDRVPPADDIYYRPKSNAVNLTWQIPTNGGDTEFNNCDDSESYANLTVGGNFTADPDVGVYGALNAGSPAIEAGLTISTISGHPTGIDIDDAIDYTSTNFTDFVNTITTVSQGGSWNIGPFGNNEAASSTPSSTISSTISSTPSSTPSISSTPSSTVSSTISSTPSSTPSISSTPSSTGSSTPSSTISSTISSTPSSTPSISSTPSSTPSAGWTGTIMGIADPERIMGVLEENIDTVMGV